MIRVVEYAPHPETGEWWPVATISDERVRLGQWPGPKLDDGHQALLHAGMRQLIQAGPSNTLPRCMGPHFRLRGPSGASCEEGT